MGNKHHLWSSWNGTCCAQNWRKHADRKGHSNQASDHSWTSRKSKCTYHLQMCYSCPCQAVEMTQYGGGISLRPPLLFFFFLKKKEPKANSRFTVQSYAELLQPKIINFNWASDGVTLHKTAISVSPCMNCQILQLCWKASTWDQAESRFSQRAGTNASQCLHAVSLLWISACLFLF